MIGAWNWTNSQGVTLLLKAANWAKAQTYCREPNGGKQVAKELSQSPDALKGICGGGEQVAGDLNQGSDILNAGTLKDDGKME
jgi:hypothetical protein